jgi:hypothetical protein
VIWQDIGGYMGPKIISKVRKPLFEKMEGIFMGWFVGGNPTGS